MIQGRSTSNQQNGQSPSPRTLWFSCGTAGELIKLAPVIRLAESAREQGGRPWFLVSTGQSGVNFHRQWEELGLPRERLVQVIEHAGDLQTSAQALRWFLRALALGPRRLRKKLRAALGVFPQGGNPGPEQDDWIVHGDTLSTAIGAIWAQRLGLRLSHVEAGLRSPSLWKPFPEEITRRWVSRLARLHFAQDSVAVGNLRRSRVLGKVVCTWGNTLSDALASALSGGHSAAAQPWGQPSIPASPFALANLHRFENLQSERNWKILVDTLVKAASTLTVYLVQHPPTQAKLQADSQARDRLVAAGVRLLPRLPFGQFAALLRASQFIISDGGSNQEECHYLGKPCLLLREYTERQEGLNGGSCWLSQLDEKKIDEFLAEPSRFQRQELLHQKSPSRLILSELGDGRGGS